jgi:hypothetical protein
MEGSMSHRFGLLALAALLAAPALSGRTAAGADPPAQPAAELSACLQRTQARGLPTVVVATSATKAESQAFWSGLAESAWVRAHRDRLQLVELPVEASPELAERLQVRTVPTVLIYGVGPTGPTCRARKACERPAEAIAWLQALALIAPEVPARPLADPAVTRAAHDGYPSAQAPAVTPLAGPSAQPQPQFTPAAVPSFAPATTMMVPQMAVPASVVSVPGPNIVLQPSVSMAPAMAAPAMTGMPAGNMFLPGPAAPTAAMVMVPAAVPAVNAPVAAPAAGAGLAAVNNQTIALSTSGTERELRVRGGGPLHSMARATARALNRFAGELTVEERTRTRLNAPPMQSGGGLATLTTNSVTPLPQSTPTFVPQAAPPGPAPTPQHVHAPPLPSPQGTPHRHFFHKHHTD